MARARKGGQSPEEKSSATTGAPKGFRSVTRSVAAWFSPDLGDSVQGRILNMRYHSKNRNFYYLIQLEAECRGIIKDGEVLDLGVGQVIGVGERFGLQELREYVATHGRCYIKPLKKVKTETGRSFWEFDLAISEDSRRGKIPDLRSIARAAQNVADDSSNFDPDNYADDSDDDFNDRF